VITASRGDTYLELYILDLEPCPGFPDECQRYQVDGFNFGLSPNEELDRAIESALAFIEERERSLDAFTWAFAVDGEFVAEVPAEGTAAPGDDADIVSLDSGTFEGRLFFKMDLGAPIPDPGEQVIKEYTLWFRSNEGDLINTTWAVGPGSDPVASSFCVGATPSCPDGIFPFGVEVGDTVEDLTFFLEGDAFDNSTGVTVSASVQTGSADAPDDLVTVEFQGGERFPRGTEERDPC
jgi:hypothetical protein